mgnify:CR=1 FL=1|tara:strand:+ start:377 stop:967 length:591 start_codon:yes stop_codon:yes gene_type:complete
MKKSDFDLNDQLKDNINTHLKILKISDQIHNVIRTIHKKLKNGGKIMFCGNGGSAADAQHLAAEFIVRLRPHVNRMPIPALTLAQDTSTLTACGNDYNFDDIFLRMFQAIADKNDILICISTSGKSRNILKVLKEAKRRKIYSIGFLGKGGGQAKLNCDKPLIIESQNTARIQECHIFLGHYILEKVENLMLNKKF